MNTWIYKRLVDKMMDAYVDWREACGQVHDASYLWRCSAGQDAGAADAAYAAALDCEERAAEVYERLVRRVSDATAPRRVWNGKARAATRDAHSR